MHKEEQRNAESQKGRRIPVDENKKGSTSEQRAQSTKQQRKRTFEERKWQREEQLAEVRESKKSFDSPKAFLNTPWRAQGGRGVMGRFQKSRKPLPRPLLSFAT
ncbi:hypothetical protein PIB30_109510, partial [Stylosanthes scabra]|nr:hypothetical protein [Stylosanthes scabra]